MDYEELYIRIKDSVEHAKIRGVYIEKPKNIHGQLNYSRKWVCNAMCGNNVVVLHPKFVKTADGIVDEAELECIFLRDVALRHTKLYSSALAKAVNKWQRPDPVKDLTEDGDVESNPGPAPQDVETAVEEAQLVEEEVIPQLPDEPVEVQDIQALGFIARCYGVLLLLMHGWEWAHCFFRFFMRHSTLSAVLMVTLFFASIPRHPTTVEDLLVFQQEAEMRHNREIARLTEVVHNAVRAPTVLVQVPNQTSGWDRIPDLNITWDLLIPPADIVNTTVKYARSSIDFSLELAYGYRQWAWMLLGLALGLSIGLRQTIILYVVCPLISKVQSFLFMFFPKKRRVQKVRAWLSSYDTDCKASYADLTCNAFATLAGDREGPSANCALCWEAACFMVGVDMPMPVLLFAQQHDCPLVKTKWQAPLLVRDYILYLKRFIGQPEGQMKDMPGMKKIVQVVEAIKSKGNVRTAFVKEDDQQGAVSSNQLHHVAMDSSGERNRTMQLNGPYEDDYMGDYDDSDFVVGGEEEEVPFTADDLAHARRAMRRIKDKAKTLEAALASMVEILVVAFDQEISEDWRNGRTDALEDLYAQVPDLMARMDIRDGGRNINDDTRFTPAQVVVWREEIRRMMRRLYDAKIAGGYSRQDVLALARYAAKGTDFFRGPVEAWPEGIPADQHAVYNVARFRTKVRMERAFNRMMTECDPEGIKNLKYFVDDSEHIVRLSPEQVEQAARALKEVRTRQCRQRMEMEAAERGAQTEAPKKKVKIPKFDTEGVQEVVAPQIAQAGEIIARLKAQEEQSQSTASTITTLTKMMEKLTAKIEAFDQQQQHTAEPVVTPQDNQVGEITAKLKVQEEQSQAIASTVTALTKNVEKLIAKVEVSTRQQQPAAESAVVGSNPVPLMYVVHVTDDSKGWASNGLVVRGPGTDYWVNAARHRYVGDKLAEYTPVVGASLKFKTAVGKTGFFMIRDYHFESVDSMWLACYSSENLFTHTEQLRQEGIATKPKNFAEGIRKLASLRFYDSHASMVVNLDRLTNRTALMVRYNPETDQFETLGGPLQSYVNPDLISYEISTGPGCCRAPVFGQDGRVIAGHWASRSGKGATGGSFQTLPPTNQKEWNRELKWDETWYNFVPQGTQFVGKLPPEQYKGFAQAKKVWDLRTDKGLLGAIDVRYRMMSPSTEMVEKEVQRFEERSPNGSRFDSDFIASVVECYDLDVSTLTQPLEEDTLSTTVDWLCTGENQANVAGMDGQNRAYVVSRGDGDYELGRQVVVAETLQIIKTFDEERPNWKRSWYKHFMWMVSGKKDGYKESKMDIGRSIQMPAFVWKLIYYTLFGEADAKWVSRMPKGLASWNFTGHDFDMPVSVQRVRTYMKARSALAVDMSAFDRHIPAWCISRYFSYLKRMYPLVPSNVLAAMEWYTCDSVMVCSNGNVYQKHNGNPSGFMNTIRLNCFVSLLVWVSVLMWLEEASGFESDSPDEWFSKLKQDFHVEICGDDTRVWALTDHAAELLGEDGCHAMRVLAEQWPWNVKLEGYTKFDLEKPFDERVLAAPPMVARKLVPLTVGRHVYLFEPMYNPSRCIRKLVHAMGGTDLAEKEQILVDSAVSCVALWWYAMDWTHEAVVPSVRSFLDLWGDDRVLDLLKRRVARILSENITAVLPIARAD